ncbi:MAG: hypothetical protein LBT80_01590 [Lactobacillaceae bacterium]|jgi:hypothetical protein|nr:hypothetical protein [Lactobacillaceae bacterium]
MITSHVEHGVRNFALKSALWVVFSCWFTVLLLVGIGVWKFVPQAMFTEFTPGIWLTTGSTTLASVMLLFNISCRYIKYKVARAERILLNTKQINFRLNQLVRETKRGNLLTSRDILLELIDIAEYICFHEMDLALINGQYVVFIDEWMHHNLSIIKSYIQLESSDIRVLIKAMYLLSKVGDYDRKIL